MAELLKYSFQNADFYRDSSGFAKLKNLGTLGSANDATLHTGQGLEFDGADDYIDTEFLDFSSGGSVIVYMTTSDSDAYCGVHDGTNGLFCGISGGDYSFGWGDGTTSATVSGSPAVARFVISSDNSGTYGCYVNGVSVAGAESGTITNKFSSRFKIGGRSDGVNMVSGVIFSIIILSVQMTADDALYDWQNPEALVEMAATGTDNLNFSFPASAILHCIPLDEGAGNTVYDIVTGKSYTMVSFPTDDTQWTNADQNEYSHQLARFTVDNNGNPYDSAKSHTIVYTNEPVQSISLNGGDTVEDNSGVSVA